MDKLNIHLTSDGYNILSIQRRDKRLSQFVFLILVNYQLSLFLKASCFWRVKHIFSNHTKLLNFTPHILRLQFAHNRNTIFQLPFKKLQSNLCTVKPRAFFYNCAKNDIISSTGFYFTGVSRKGVCLTVLTSDKPTSLTHEFFLL